MIALGGAAIADWMVDTFIYTSLLIGLVLLVRRRVAEYFGPQIAYALWALPLLRFVMPPLVLPAWMKPAEPVAEAAPVAAAESGEPLMVFITGEVEAAPLEATPVAAPWFDITVTDILLPLWLGGAAIFLAMRVRDYVRMRRDLLAPARPVGEAGKVRLVETPAVSAPIAFGIRDKVVALPPEFMDRIDVTARDMAIAHELEHHRGHDLLANIAAQPLLALHWFNPLAWWGWRAMRRDQEAACDARVVAGRARSERAAYAEVIAGFAAGEHLALAAPMACPVLGEKSIIHRLRSLTMQDISSRRRKFGIAAITTTALALPLTASISYAQAEPDRFPEAPKPPEAPAAPDYPVAPDAPAAPEAPAFPEGDPTVEIIELENGQRIIIRTNTETEQDGERRTVRRVVTRTSTGDAGDPLTEEQIAAILAEVDAELGDLDIEIGEQLEVALSMAAEAEESAMRRMVLIEDEQEGVRRLNIRCEDGEHIARRELGDGRTAMVVCNANIEAHAATSMRRAIEGIANNPNLPAETRREIIEEMEEAIEEMESARREVRRVSFAPEAPKPPAAPVTAPRVVFGFTATARPAAASRAVPMVHPLTGRLATPAEVEEDCEEEEARTRYPARVTA